MDGILVHTNAKLNPTPFNFSLGIFNTAARCLPEAWEIIYFPPDKKIIKEKSDCIFTVTNLHMCLKAALKSFKDICDDNQQ